MSKENNEEKILEGKNITVGICAVGAVEELFSLLHSLKKSGANLELILTPNAAQIMPLVLLQRVSSKPILWDQMELPKIYDPSHKKEKQDLFLIAPATANTVSKAACGIGDNLLTSRILSADCPVAFSISCNPHMYNNPAVQRNIKTLKEDGRIFFENPEKPNRMPPVNEIVSGIADILK